MNPTIDSTLKIDSTISIESTLRIDFTSSIDSTDILVWLSPLDILMIIFRWSRRWSIFRLSCQWSIESWLNQTIDPNRIIDSTIKIDSTIRIECWLLKLEQDKADIWPFVIFIGNIAGNPLDIRF